jgi:pimeloyl-ACP methyl ester carboxylesterase
MSGREFDAVGAALADTFDLVPLDLPGFGDEPTTGGVTVEDMVASVVRRIGEHAPSRWILVGHSMGGKIASIVAAHTIAGRVGLFGLAGVVLLAASPPSPEPMGDDRRAEMLGWAADGRLHRSAARAFVDANVGAPLDPAADDRAVADVLRTDGEAWTAWLERGSREDWSEVVGTSDVPAVIVAGGADGDLGADAQRRLNGPVYPSADVIVLEGAGHLLPLERPAEVAEVIRTFWDSWAGRGPAVPEDFARTIASPRTSARTRSLLAARALADAPGYEPRALSAAQLDTLRVLADVVVPQDAPAIDLAVRLDVQLADGLGDGWRNAALPPDPEAYRLGLDALASLGALDAPGRQALVASAADGRFSAPTSAFSPEQIAAWLGDVRVDLVRLWLAHPATMSRIGYDGVANGGDGTRFPGFQRIGADEHEGWEPRMETAR